MIKYELVIGNDSIVYLGITIEIDKDQINSQDNSFGAVLNVLSFMNKFYDSIKWEKNCYFHLKMENFGSDYEHEAICFFLNIEIPSAHLLGDTFSLFREASNDKELYLKNLREMKLHTEDTSYERWKFERENNLLSLKIQDSESKILDSIKSMEVFKGLDLFFTGLLF